MKANALVCVLVLVALGGPLSAGEPAMVTAYKGPAPTLDGKLDEPCWNQASTAFPFLVLPMNYPAIEETRLALSFDDGHLYAAFDCRCLDAEKLRAADGEPGLNDRVELLLHWVGAPPATVVADAGGRLKCSAGVQGVRAAVSRWPRAYTLELAIPRPSRARRLEFVARRYNEVTGEVSTWGTERARALAALAEEPGPCVKIDQMNRRPESRESLLVTVANPREGYAPVRCRVSLSEASRATPHLVRLRGQQSIATKIHYTDDAARATGLQFVFDEPQGREVYLRTPSFVVPPGPPARTRAIPVIPYPRRVSVNPEAEPFVVDRRCRIVIGRRHNEVERRAAESLRRAIRERCGLDLPIARRSYFLPSHAIVVATARTSLLARRLALAFGLKWEEEEAPDQTYVLGVRRSLIGVAGMTDVGTLYGAQSLLQLLASAECLGKQLVVPAMKVSDHPACALRGWLWRGPRPDHPALYAALARFKVNLLTGVPEADLEAARAQGIYSATLALPGPRDLGREPAAVRLEPSQDMPRLLRRALRLPILLEEDHVEPPPEPTPEELEAARKEEELRKQREEMELRLRRRRPGWAKAIEPLALEDPVTVEPVRIAWVRGEPAALQDAGAVAELRPDIVGLCGGLRDAPSLLPPSWARVAAAAEYGWTARTPSPEVFRKAFYESFYGTAEVGEARDLLERAEARLPRRTALRDLLDPAVPAPSAPGEELPGLVMEATLKAARATRNQELAALLAASGPRILAAATNVRTALRVRQLAAEAQSLSREKRHADAAQRLGAIAACLAEGAAGVTKLLGSPAAAADDLELYAAAAAAAKTLAAQAAKGEALPPPERVWALLRGGTR
jgi:hypothetical protein